MLNSRNSRRIVLEDKENMRNLIINRKNIAETGIIPPGYRLIRDMFPFEVVDTKKSITEGYNGNENHVVKVTGLIQLGDTENANGRFYRTKDVLRPAIENIQEDIGARAVLGELDHANDAKIHLDRVSHLMTKVWMEGKKVYGEAEILYKLPMGAALRGLFEHKVRVGISSRGIGDMELVEHNGKELYNVLPGFSIVTWDVVAEPSVSNAILSIKEGLTRRLAPVKKHKNNFSPEVYQGMLVSEINKFFGVK